MQRRRAPRRDDGRESWFVGDAGRQAQARAAPEEARPVRWRDGVKARSSHDDAGRDRGEVEDVPASQSSQLTIDEARLWSRVQRLATVGAVPEHLGGGLDRPSFGDAHAEATRLVARWMLEAGLDVTLDETGNLVGLLRGREPDLPAVGVGSHLDTVPHGGAFDGALGVLAALEAVATLVEVGERPRKSIAVVAFADEEGNTFGVGVLSAQLWTGEITGKQITELVDAGGRSLPDRVAEFDVGLRIAPRPELAVYLEAHVEQGPQMERWGGRAAAVTTIVGIARATVRFVGKANHSGTTPMEQRHDAACAGSQLVLDVRDMARAGGGALVGNVGVFEIAPGATNVVPGSARLRIEFRSPDLRLLEDAMRAVEARARDIAETNHVDVEIEPWHVAKPVDLDPAIVRTVQDALCDAGLPAHTMPSWAGHDAKVMARHMPTGMLFVPSVDGISHAPDERTKPEDCSLAAEVLVHALRRLARSD